MFTIVQSLVYKKGLEKIFRWVRKAAGRGNCLYTSTEQLDYEIFNIISNFIVLFHLDPPSEAYIYEQMNLNENPIQILTRLCFKPQSDFKLTAVIRKYAV